MYICKKCKSQNLEIIPFSFQDITFCKNCNNIKSEKLVECCKNPFKNIVIEYLNNGNCRLFYQCLNCGGAFRNKQLSFKDHSSNIRSEFSENKFLDWQSKKTIENNFISSVFFNISYNEYLYSDQWKNLRTDVFKRDNNICKVCNSNKATEVHHLTYLNIFNEKLSDLISICRSCHKEIHNK